jgi:hypothetical protein
MKNSDITLHVTMAPDAAIALSKFVKTAEFDHYRAIAETEKEAFAMVSASHSLRCALANQGYTKRAI